MNKKKIGQIGHRGHIKDEEIDIPEVCIDAMVEVYDGGFVFDVNIGNRLCLVQSLHPELIDLFNPPKNHWNKKIIFGAQLTEAGKEYIDALFKD